MKVWLVTNAYLPEKGGLVTYTRNLALQLIKEGKDVGIITSNLKDKNLKRIEEIEGVEVSRIDYSSVPIFLKPFAPLVYFYLTYKHIKNIDIKENDIVISRFYTFALAVALAKKIKKHIFISPLIASKLQYIEAKETKKFKKIYLYFTLPQLAFLDKMAIKLSPFIAVLSNSKQKEVADYYNIKDQKSISVIPPGVDMSRFNLPSSHEKNSIRSSLGYSIEDKIIVCVSRLSTEKNLEILFHTINDMKDANIKLAIVGEGHSRGNLERLISKYKLEQRVKLWGARQNVEDFYKMADTFILLSKYEGFGHVYLEALSCGLPCIAARSNPPVTITASDEIIINDKIGYLVNYDQKKEIIEAISNCLEQGNENQKYRRDYVMENYTWSKHFNVIENIVTTDM
ncbi:glycosyltransferase family 4 protein [Guptibacillus hwajinpoensis]|uniref:Glycosyl transferase family 1 n=1 Tax=Guptibacillus hwajinpoensis TaxID=208199 RepID=A0A0J6CKI6_9BACL|nr:glycosyltransferase family 4 protein [Alkalihalobacillus macyae]KMM36751.1 hypothetical protein AB986_12480 [Alkalihalobacillus macyae]